MVYTRFGTQVEVVSVNIDTGMMTARAKGIGAITAPIVEFRADGGLDEIMREAASYRASNQALEEELKMGAND